MAFPISMQCMVNSTVFFRLKRSMIEGDLPSRSQKLVNEWGVQYQSELLRMWQNNEYKQLPGLE